VENYSGLLRLFLDHLQQHLSGLKGKTPAELYEPENYILSLGGKRLRPLLTLAACDLFNADPKKALHAALAVELFHNFSLIHDDILDVAPLRRNQPTVHTKWNTGIAILSGDAMLVKAFMALESHEPTEYKQLSIVLQRTAIEVCEGQQMDMNFENAADVSVEDYVRMITCKTACLLGCSLQMGAIAAGADSRSQEILYHFGVNLGISFQLMDDLLDAFGKSPAFGKQPGGDIIANKKTFLLVKARELANNEQRQKMQALSNETKPSLKINGMLDIFKELNVEAICRTEAEKHTDAALQGINNLPATEEKIEALKNYTISLLKREV